MQSSYVRHRRKTTRTAYKTTANARLRRHASFHEEIAGILKQLEDAAQYGMVLRAKGYVASNDSDRWIHFDYVPGESDIREGGAMVTGRVCVIGSKLNESAIASLFGA